MFGAVCLTGTRTGRHVYVNCTYKQLLEAHNAVDSKLMTPFFCKWQLLQQCVTVRRADTVL
jgi:hypothetical protein